jgi:uncharacterized protein YegJ (DUF2314 family)
MVLFSTQATELMARRARATYAVFRSLRHEFADLPLPALVKLRYAIDDGTGAEHLWFEVHKLNDASMEATLVNQPLQIAGMRPGELGEHLLDNLSDWVIMSPVGSITPANMQAAREIRQRKKEIIELIRRQDTK